MVSRYILLSVLSGVVLTGFSSWQFIKILFWLSIVLIVLLSTLDKIPYLNKNLDLGNFIQKRYLVLKSIVDSLDNILLLRVPIVSGLIFFLFPIISQWLAPALLQNLFAMRSDSQIFSVMIASTLVSILIVSLSKTILALYYNQNNDYQSLRILLSIGLVLPTWIVIYLNSFSKAYQEDSIQIISFILGLIISFAIFVIVSLYDSRQRISSAKINNLSNQIFPEELSTRRKLFYWVQIGVGFLLYLFVIVGYRPESKNILPLSEAPALLYLLLLIWLFTFILGGITLFFDGSFKEYINKDKKSNESTKTDKNSNIFRFPILIFVFLFVIFSYSVWEVDHYFELIPSSRNPQAIDYQRSFEMALKKRLSHQVDEEKTLVVVASSGGGIQASGWTTQVLVGLQQELGESFINAIGLISSVSGGSVGTMFYLDQFDQGKSTPTLANLDKILSNSTDDWLNAVGWGLAYPDLVRAIGLPFLNVNKYFDRGYSLEKAWQKKLQSPATLEDWHQRILAGEIPIPVFNSTLVENGSRFLISPMKFIPGELSELINKISNFENKENNNEIEKSKALDFKTLYANACKDEKINQHCDIRVTTAARLSASFPYVTPMARNDRENKIKIFDKSTNKEKSFVQNYHMADGGYFDNSGLFTAVEWLDKLLTSLDSSTKQIKITKVLLIQINAFPDSQFNEQEKGDKGLNIVALGPLEALYSVRDSTQFSRNLREVKLLKKRWSKQVEIEHFVISFPEKDQNGNNYNQPLSWRLTQRQKSNLKDAWMNDQRIGEEVRKIKNFWQKDLKG